MGSICTVLHISSWIEVLFWDNSEVLAATEVWKEGTHHNAVCKGTKSQSSKN